MFFPALLLIRISSSPTAPENLRAVVLTTTNSYNNVNAHAAGGSLHALDGCVQRSGVQIRHLLLGDVRDLLLRDLADFVLVGRARTLSNARGPLQQHRCRRCLGDK